jgi:hypothetical protein
MLILQLFLQCLRDTFEDNVRVKSRLMMKDAVKKTIGMHDVLRSTAVLLLVALLRGRDRH